ncbi:MAG: Lrp/AsnC family transcriptional regulator [Alphaproteobacteria bacterium]|nr:Lrp/AsnC family transcriptional regulator [Alphaproteobacteria bacterium]
MDALDEYDTKILNLLQANNRLTSEAIANAVALSPTACQRRIRRLRDSGVIAAEFAVLDPEKLGGMLTVIVQVVLKRGGAHTVDAFKRDVRGIPEIQQCYYVTGEYDFVLIVTAKDMADYDRLTRGVFFENTNIEKFHTIVAIQNVKVGLRIPL